MTFSQKLINVQFDLANGSFGKGKNNSALITGARVSCHITNTGGASQSWLEMAIYGLPLSLMNQLSTVGTQAYKLYQNSVTVEAGDASGMTLVFGGQITSAFVDAQSMPQVCFRVMARPGAFQAIKPATPLSIRGSADVAGMMQNLAKQMGYGFENGGVTAKLSNPYYAGTPLQQALAIAKHAGIDMIIERNTLAIVPANSTRQGDAILISPETGMIGYPAFNQANVLVRALFNPAVQYLGSIEVKSDLTPANGKWKVNRLEYQLESLIPHGRWEMAMEGVQIGAMVS
ncbi:baseplate hub protein [Rhizobium sp.]|uniref:baseplate hub protein n=1 Tax=Rhizobium sp. TaxID=391 RepID=UPI003F7DB06D